MGSGNGDAPEKNNENEEIPFIYKKSSFTSVSGSRSGLDRDINVVDGKLTDKKDEEHHIHGVLHKHQKGQEEHTHHHVHIDQEIRVKELPDAIDGDKKEEGELAFQYEGYQPQDYETPAIAPEEHSNVKNEESSFVDNSNVIEEDFERKHEKQHLKVNIQKGTLKTIQEMYPDDEKRQESFLESVLAAQHVKDLTMRYGSKQKNVRQFFLEAVDEDTRLAIFGSEEVEEAQMGLKKLEAKKGRVQHHGFESISAFSLIEDNTSPVLHTDSSTTSPIGHSDNTRSETTENLIGVWSKKNFWDSLERLEMEQDPEIENTCVEGKGNPLYEIYGPKWKRSQRLTDQAVTNSRKPSVVKHDYEPFPDKYLDIGVQEVQQSEAVRRLWDIVNAQIELFDAKDPLAYEMFGCLYDEVRNFVKLPEEDIIDFNNGIWEPVPLDEKMILSMEPYEKLMTRFLVYQKALCFMAQHFELMAPIFGEIKQAYEDVFDKGEKETAEVEKEQMEELEMRQYLGKYVRHTDRVGHRQLIQVKAESLALQEHIQWQHHTLHTILGMLWKMRSSLKLTSWAVSQLKNMHKSKIEVLAKEIVSTQGQMMFDMALPGKYTEIMKRIQDQSDPKEIRRILLAARRQLRLAHRKIVVFEADYADTVPRTEFEVPQKKYNLISKKNESLQDACNALKAERQQKKQVIAGLKSEIYETSGLVKDLRRKPTPRPSWTKISNEWPQGQSKFSQLKDGQSTREVINKVVEEMSGKKVGELTTYILPQGKGDHVPAYLRYDKPLLKRSFTAAESIMLIKDIWRKRVDVVRLYRKIKQARRDEEEGLASFPDDLQYEYPEVGTLSEFVAEYFVKRCHLEQIRMEWAYNLMEACKIYSSDAKLAQFKGILEGSIDESIYHLFQMELEMLQDFMYAKANQAQEHKGYLQWPDVIKHVGDLCPNKTDEQLNAVNDLGGKSYGVRGTWAVVRAQNLFEVDDDGKESDFVELMYLQFEEERKLYIRDIYMELLSELGISEKLLEHEDDPVWQTDVSMHMFFACIQSVDQTLPDYKLIQYLAWVYLGVTALPGVTTLGTRLVEFLKERAHLTETELEKYNEDEDIEFENCIRELREYEEDEATMDKLDLKKRRLTTKKLRFASLRQVMDGLYSGPFVRFGQRIEKFKAAEPEPEVAEVSKDQKQHKHHHHHHHHHHHKHDKKKNDGKDDGEVDAVFVS